MAMSSDEIRDTYRSFFEQRDHLRLPSASLVPAAYDPSVLLTTAGMHPLMPYFLQQEKPPHARLTSCQKCFRTVDIDIIGTTHRHLTFFEMLGNFSMGDYFKEDAIAFAWELSTQGFGFDPERIWVTVFGGDEVLGLGPDEEAIGLWEAIGMPRERIVECPRSENFWQAGPTGPCGPCSELYLDRGLDFGTEDDLPGGENERFLEFWNLVFMTFKQGPPDRLTPLPARNIDTGLGLNRLAAILQGKESVFETDQFQPLIALGEQLGGRKYGADSETTRSLRILADHTRAMTFLVADGVVPSNEDRGYILRRVMRRAIQHGRALGFEPGFLPRFAQVVEETMGGAYPELGEQRDAIHKWLVAEEEGFGRTLEQGTKLLDDLIAQARDQGEEGLGADDVFQLHDTFGFPIDLTREIAAEHDLGVDEPGFERLMDEQRTRARAGGRGAATADVLRMRAQELAGRAQATVFTGYEETERRTAVAALEVEDGRVLAKLDRVALLRRRRRPGLRRGLRGVRGRRLSRARRAGLPPRERRGPGARARPRGRRAEAGRGGAGGRGPPCAPRDAVQPHRDAPAARGAARAARDARAPGRLGGAAGQAALRLHARRRADARRAESGRGRRQRLDPGEPLGARPDDDARRGQVARRDGAVRREVR